MLRPSPFALLLLAPATLVAQAPAARPSQLGTVKAMDGKTLTVSNAQGVTATATLSDDTKFLQLPPGSTDLKTATPSALTDISLGDRVLVTGASGDTPTALTAARVILMKSSDIASRNAGQQADWQRRGSGGLVKSVDGSTLTMTAGARAITVTTTPQTMFRRYADDSISFADAKPSDLASIQSGDQISVRGAKSADGTAITAEEIVTGTFENFSGILSATDPAAGTVTLKDLTTKKTVTVAVTTKSDLRKLTPEAAARFAPGGGPGAGGAASARPANAQGGEASGGGTRTYGGGAGGPGGAGSGRPRNAGLDLSRMLSRLPTQTVADLHSGQAVMIVASQSRTGTPTAVTLLSGGALSNPLRYPHRLGAGHALALDARPRRWRRTAITAPLYQAEEPKRSPGTQ